MVLKVVGSTPISRPIIDNIGVSPSGKAPDFDSGIRRFKSCHPSQEKQQDPLDGGFDNVIQRFISSGGRAHDF